MNRVVLQAKAVKRMTMEHRVVSTARLKVSRQRKENDGILFLARAITHAQARAGHGNHRRTDCVRLWPVFNDHDASHQRRLTTQFSGGEADRWNVGLGISLRSGERDVASRPNDLSLLIFLPRSDCHCFYCEEPTLTISKNSVMN